MPKGVYTRQVRPVLIPIGPSIAYVPLSKGMFALINRDDALLVGIYNWTAMYNPTTGSYYAYRKFSGKSVTMHQFLIDPGQGKYPDHINLRGLDNRRANLRIATGSQSQANKRKYRNNLCGLKGVSLDKVSGRWRARICVGGQQITIGRFETPAEAHAAYGKAAELHYGAFARTQ